MLLRGKLQIDEMKSKFEKIESALFMKSVSMPLMKQLLSKVTVKSQVLKHRLITVVITWVTHFAKKSVDNFDTECKTC